jgi:hypothetical protein
MPIDKSTEEDYLNGRTFAQGYFLRIDAARADAARATPKCKNGVSYSCGKSCISLKKNCKSEPQDEKGKQILKAVKSKASEFAKTKAKTPKATPVKPTEIKPDVEAPPPPQGDIKVKASKSKTKVSKPVAVEAEKKATPAKTKKAKPSTKLSEVSKEQKKVEAIAKPSKTIGDGTHDGAPKNAQEYYDMVTKSGGKITKEEAEGTARAIEKWGFDSNYVRDVQKAGKSSQDEQYITDYINNSTPYKGEVYRGLLIWMENPMDLMKVGQPLDNQGAHASWTSKLQVAEYFADVPDELHYSVVIKSINNKTGASIRNIAEEWQGGFTKMEEVIVPKNAKHIVRSIKETRKDVFFVEVEEV